MAENADAAIKLFGKTIPLRHREQQQQQQEEEDGGRGEEKKAQDVLLHKQENTTRSNIHDHESTNSTSTSENNKPPSAGGDQEDDSTKNHASNSKEKTVKKPDKILPCPRCKSLDTKFCYYNNYNVNQPRHFCKNCQRYWTAGGTMRNVPVGAGRRKNKNSCHYRHIAIPESALQALRSDEPSVHYPSLRPNGTVLSFGSNSAFCNSMASANLSEKTRSCHRNGFYPSAVNDGDHEKLRPPLAAATPEETSSKISLNEHKSQISQAAPAQIPWFNGSTWSYPWSPALPLCSSNIPIPVYPAAAAYWSCAAVPPGTWSLPWASPVVSSSLPNGCHPGAATSSPVLGKHSRDGEDGHKQIHSHETSSCVLVPKTLRIDDPEEAAKSSIWTMVGNIRSSKKSAVGGGELLKAFQPKGDLKNHPLEAPPLLYANPAALSRSLNFQETS